MSILGARTVQQMGLVDVHFERIHLMTTIPEQPPRNLIDEYKDVFDKEFGTIGSKLHLQTDTQVRPTQLPVRRVPVAVKMSLKPGSA